MADHQAPGLSAVIFLQPVFRHVRHCMCVIARDDFSFLAMEVELRVEVLALTFVRHEPVKAWARIIVVLAHVPLADVGRFVTCGLKHQRKALHPCRIFREVVDDSMSMSVQTTQNAGATGRTQCRRTE